VKYAFMRANRKEFELKRMCWVLQVSRSGYYDWAKREESKHSQRDHVLLKEIRKVHQETKEAYGATKTWQTLKQSGTVCGKHRVARLRRQAGIEAQRKRKFRLAYKARNTAPAAANLLRWPFKADYPDQIWVTDVTFVPTRSGWLYLAVMIDLQSRVVVGWSMKERPNQELVNEALMMAVEQRRPKPGLIHHSDQGILYSSGSYLALLKKYGMLRSMSGKGNCYDNAVAESFFSSLKNEIVHHRNYQTRDEARAEIFEYIELFYNRKRLHQSLNYQIPMQYKSDGVSPN
jgi:putative transposase